MSEEKNIPEETPQKQSTNLSADRPGSFKQEAKTISQTESQASNIQVQTTNMETHAHHLHKAPGKKWTHYLFEFLMLFLAVFCGFLAENFREHQVEKERGKQYIRSLYEDLRYDTTKIADIIDMETIKIAALRKLPDCYDSIKKNRTRTECLFDLIKNSNSNNNFHITDRTLRQLANAGGFRLLNKQDADSIVSYQNDATNILDFETTLYQPAQDNVRSTFNELIEFSANTKIYSNVTENPVGYNIQVNLPLLFSADNALLNKYFNQLFLYTRTIIRHRIHLMNLKQHATRLIEYYKDKHHFE